MTLPPLTTMWILRCIKNGFAQLNTKHVPSIIDYNKITPLFDWLFLFISFYFGLFILKSKMIKVERFSKLKFRLHNKKLLQSIEVIPDF